jgi:hypothetical protein
VATHTVAADEIGAHSKTLGANTVDTVNFADDVKQIEVVSDGAAELYFTVDGTAPTVGGAKCYYLPAFGGAREVPVHTGGTVKLISSGTPKYSVARVP